MVLVVKKQKQKTKQNKKNLPANSGDVRNVGLIPGSGRSPGGGHGNPLQYSCLENPIDRGASLATDHRVAELDTIEQLSRQELRKQKIKIREI